MGEGGSPRRQRPEGAPSLNPRERKTLRGQRLTEGGSEVTQGVSYEKARESKSLIEKAKSLQRDGVIIEWPQEVEDEASQIKTEAPRDSSSSGLVLVGLPTNVEPAVL
eukprot:12423448-Karenia_brevis.AAC.1